MSKRQEILKKFPDETFTFADGLDNAIIGVDYDNRGIIYSMKKALIEYKKQFPKGTNMDEILECFYYNTIGSKGLGWIWLDDRD